MSRGLRIESLQVRYGNEMILNSVNLDVHGGELMAILGPSGCGKSTMLKAVAGLITPSKGKIRIDGKVLGRTAPEKRSVGFVFQDYSLFPMMSVRSNVEFGPKMRGVRRRERRKRADRLIELMGLAEQSDKHPHQLSGGQKQRVAIARALASEPDVLLLDEPFSALDAKIRKRLRRDLKTLIEELKTTTIFVTHDQEEAFELGDRIALMNDGLIEQVGRPRDLYEDPVSLFVSGFVGVCNVIDLGDDLPLKVVVRPEDIRISPNNGSFNDGKVRGLLLSYRYMGPFLECLVSLQNGDDLKVFLTREEFKLKGLRRGMEVRIKVVKFRSFKKDSLS